jgi:hypothetical protein
LFKSSELEDRLARVLGQLDQNLEGYFNIDNSAKHLKKIAYALRCFKLYRFFFFWQAGLDVRDESLCCTLV